MISGKILYFTDKFKVSKGYEPAFGRILKKAGIKRLQVFNTHIYDLVDTPLIRKGNEKTWRFNPERKREIESVFRQRVQTIQPQLIVVSDPAVLGILVGWDWNLATLDKCRGGVYYFDGIPCIVTYPITVVHTHVDESLAYGEDDDNKQQPYRVKSGSWILQRDWEKVGRYLHGKQKRLPPFVYSVCRTIDDCLAARDWLRSACIIATDTETGCFPPQVTCVGYTGLRSNGSCRTFVIPFYDPFKDEGVYWESAEDHALAYSIMRDINESPVLKALQNGPYDCSYFVKDHAPLVNYLIDLMGLWFSLYMELPKSLDFICSILLDNYQYWKDDIKGIDGSKTNKLKDVVPKTSMETYWRYNGLDCYNTLFGALYLISLLPTNPAMKHNYLNTFAQMLSGWGMSMRGVKADFRRREQHRETLTTERDSNVRRLRYMLGEPDFNINSPAQKCDLLYGVFGLRERNEKGRYVNRDKPLRAPNTPSAGKIPLKLAKTEHPLFRYIINVLESGMEPDKQISNVCNMYLRTDRFRTTYSIGPNTTRFNSRGSAFWDGGNAQNIRETMRDWLVADEGCVLFDADYSQSDDVFIGYESQDLNKIQVIESGLDGHAVHGELLFKRPYDWIVAGKKAHDPIIIDPITGVRQLSKKVVHAANFMMMALTCYMTMGRESVVAAAELLGFADAASWDQKRLVNLCARLLQLYRQKYPRLTIKEWYGELLALLKGKGTLTNAFGITRRFLGDPDDSGTLREAAAFMGQSGTGGNMNRVQKEIDFGIIPERFRDALNPDRGAQAMRMNWETHGFAFHLQTHDSFTTQLNTRHPRWKEAAHNLLHVMNRPVIIHGREVRVRTEAALGLRWSKEEMLEWDGKDPYDLDRIASRYIKLAA